MGSLQCLPSSTNKKGSSVANILASAEASNTLAMVKHCLTGETSWVTADHPLFAFLKIIQSFFWKHMMRNIVEVFGALPIEKAAWSCLGQVKDGSWSTTLLLEAEVTTIGITESCIHCAHIHPVYCTSCFVKPMIAT